MGETVEDRRERVAAVTGIIAAIVFVAIGVFLVVYTWVPAPGSLVREPGIVSGVAKRPNTWYEVTLVTQSGATLACRGRKNPIAWANRCPVEALDKLVGKSVTVAHDHGTPYVIESAGVEVLGLDAFRRGQLTAIVLALLLVAMGYIAARRTLSALTSGREAPTM